MIAGGITGTVGYVGGRSATLMILEMVNPGILQREERERLRAVSGAISERLAVLRQVPFPRTEQRGPQTCSPKANLHFH